VQATTPTPTPTLTLTDAKQSATVARALDAHVLCHSAAPVVFGSGRRIEARLARDGSWAVYPVPFAWHPYADICLGLTTAQAVDTVTRWTRGIGVSL